MRQVGQCVETQTSRFCNPDDVMIYTESTHVFLGVEGELS